jgi:hypothetical protein
MCYGSTLSQRRLNPTWSLSTDVIARASLHKPVISSTTFLFQLGQIIARALDLAKASGALSQPLQAED